MVDGIREVAEEPRQLIRIGGVERRRAARVQFLGRSLQAGRVPTGEYDVGSFGAGDMHRLDAIGPDRVLTAAQGMRDLDAVTVDAAAAASIRTGLPLDRVPLGAVGDGPWAMLDEAGELLAVYEATGSDRIRPAVVLAGSAGSAASAGSAGR